MKTLILSADTGGGHNSCAAAIKEYFEDMGEECRVVDSLAFVSERFSSLMSKGHVFMYRRVPWLFGLIYAFGEKHPDYFESDSRVGKTFGRGAEKLKEYIEENEFKAVICTHTFAAFMLAEVQQKYALEIKTAYVSTDNTCSPGVRGDGLDFYFIPDGRLKFEFESNGIPGEKIVASGIPIKKAFLSIIPKDQAKKLTGIAAEDFHIVVSCGSMGCKDIKTFLKHTAKKLPENTAITAVCGTNKKLYKALSQKYGDEKIKIEGYVNDMSLVMNSADLFVTKPGGISTAEAFAKKVPIAFMNTVGGCEAYNKRWFEWQEVAMSRKNIRSLAEECIKIAEDPGRIFFMQRGYCRKENKNAAAAIYKTMTAASSGVI